jgi:uncharacterized protein (TIGR00369 family)
MPSEQLLEKMHEIAEQLIPFNKVLGIQVDTLDFEHFAIRFEHRPELVGNFTRGMLHGGVIAAVLDVAGGMSAWMGLLKKSQGEPFEETAKRLAKIGTIDMRVDYLRPGLGKHFRATSNVLRTGNKVTVTRMELHNDEGTLIAVGTGTYIVG